VHFSFIPVEHGWTAAKKQANHVASSPICIPMDNLLSKKLFPIHEASVPLQRKTKVVFHQFSEIMRIEIEIL
jgi:hypothetical protein